MKYDIELCAVETCHDGFLRLNRYQLRHSLYAGGSSRELSRERIERLRAVAVLLYDPWRDAVVLVEQFRIGAMTGDGAQPDAWLLEIAGGMWEPGRQAGQVARQEAREETACAVDELWPIGDVWISPGATSERVMLYCGRVDAGAAGGLHGVAAEGEDIKVVVLDFAAAMAELFNGRLLSATAVMALQWLALHKSEVRARWMASVDRP
jgi:ADP-ribose pyrophosphatase